jgi:hypothetical protein
VIYYVQTIEKGTTMSEDWKIERAIKDAEMKKEIQSAVKVIVKNLNIMGNESIVGDAIKEELGCTHRTLQQGFFRNVIVPVILWFNGQLEDGRYDLRNEDACQCAKKLKPILKDSYFRFI